VQIALGYASLADQIENDFLDGTDPTEQEYLRRAFNAAFRQAGADRYRYFNYQTNDGKDFWAEGPYYFHYALGDVIPFWHAVRTNGMLNYHPYFTAPDPFTTDRFTDPLHWLANLVTPDGQTPPLDDGNKHNMRFSTVLRWTGAYGDASLGRKFAWIGDKRGFGSQNSLLLVELAIPRVEQGGGDAPASTLGNTSAGQTGENGEQQIVMRREDDVGRAHYLLLNGESKDAIHRGEGHEQADQMQGHTGGVRPACAVPEPGAGVGHDPLRATGSVARFARRLRRAGPARGDGRG
jgi:hypothetical protein